MRTFGELLKEYMDRTGISDAELARTLGVRRQTIFRWKEGSVARPRHAEDVLRCAQRLRLAPEERDELLIAAGFPPQNPPASPTRATAVPVEAGQDGAPPSPRPGQTPAARQRALRLGLWVAAGATAVAVIALLVIGWVRRATYPLERRSSIRAARS